MVVKTLRAPITPIAVLGKFKNMTLTFITIKFIVVLVKRNPIKLVEIKILFLFAFLFFIDCRISWV